VIVMLLLMIVPGSEGGSRSVTSSPPPWAAGKHRERRGCRASPRRDRAPPDGAARGFEPPSPPEPHYDCPPRL